MKKATIEIRITLEIEQSEPDDSLSYLATDARNYCAKEAERFGKLISAYWEPANLQEGK